MIMAEMEQMAAQGQSQGAPGGSAPEEVSKLVANVSKGIAMLTDVFGQLEGAPPEVMESLSEIAEKFNEIVGALSGNGEASAPSHPAAKPKQMQMVGEGKPVGPAGV